MNIDGLRECADLAKTLSFTRTAKRFYITQPVLSKHISNIERELGIEIFLRSKNGVHLTRIGKTFIKHCEAILKSYDNAIEEIEYEKNGQDKPIDLGYLYGASSFVLPGAIRAFSKTHPSIVIRYLSMEIDEIPQALDANRVDLAITTDLVKFDPDRFAWKTLYPDSLCVVVPKSHPFASKPAISLFDLTGEKVILPRSSFMPGETSHILTILNPVLKTIHQQKLISDLNSIRMALMIERCAAIEFSHLRNYFPQNEFAFVPLDVALPSFNVIAIWKHSNETTAIIDFADELERLCAKARTAAGVATK